MRPVCLVALLSLIACSGCHSTCCHTGTGGFTDTLWSGFGTGDPGCCGGGCGSSHGSCGSGCQNNCYAANTCCGCPSVGSGCGHNGTCPNCGVSGAMCASGCRACGMSYGGCAGCATGSNTSALSASMLAQMNGCLGGSCGPMGGCGPMHDEYGAAAARRAARKAAHARHFTPVRNVIHNAHQRCANGLCCGGAVGPDVGAVTYPYYTTRGPRDFLMKNPPSIGP